MTRNEQELKVIVEKITGILMPDLPECYSDAHKLSWEKSAKRQAKEIAEALLPLMEKPVVKVPPKRKETPDSPDDCMKDCDLCFEGCEEKRGFNKALKELKALNENIKFVEVAE